MPIRRSLFLRWMKTNRKRDNCRRLMPKLVFEVDGETLEKVRYPAQASLRAAWRGNASVPEGLRAPAPSQARTAHPEGER